MSQRNTTTQKKKLSFSSRLVSNVRGESLTQINNNNLSPISKKKINNEIQSRTKIWQNNKSHRTGSTKIGDLQGVNELPKGNFNFHRIKQNKKAQVLTEKYLQNLEKYYTIQNRKEQIAKILKKKGDVNIVAIEANTHTTNPIIMKYTQVLKDEEKINNILITIDHQLEELGIDSQDLYVYYLNHRKKKSQKTNRTNNNNNNNNNNRGPSLENIQRAQTKYQASTMNNNNNNNRGPSIAEIEKAQRNYQTSIKP